MFEIVIPHMAYIHLRIQTSIHRSACTYTHTHTHTLHTPARKSRTRARARGRQAAPRRPRAPRRPPGRLLPRCSLLCRRPARAFCMVFRESASTLAPLLLALPPPARAVCMVFPRKLLRARAFARDSAQPTAAAAAEEARMDGSAAGKGGGWSE